MSKKKRRKAIAPGRAVFTSEETKASARKGFDFGIELLAMLVSDMSFVDLLKQAEIVACAYGHAPEGPLGGPMLEVDLVGSHREPLVKAFNEFGRWAVSGDGDAVQLTFIFLETPGYLLLIEREHTRATWSLKGVDRTHSPLLFGATYIKKFDTRSPAVEQFREYKRQVLISPFLFGGVSIEHKTAVPSLKDISHVEGIVPLLKFEAEFLDERAIKPGSPHYPLLKMTQGASKSTKKGKIRPRALPEPQQQPADYFRHRKRMVERHFPVTIERIRAQRYSAAMEAARARGIRSWQFEQAACNLLLSRSLCQGEHFYSSVPLKEFDQTVARAIHEREERCDTPEITLLSTDDIVTQVTLDAAALLKANGKITSSSSIEDLQKRLAALSLLEPPNG